MSFNIGEQVEWPEWRPLGDDTCPECGELVWLRDGHPADFLCINPDCQSGKGPWS